jgi:hypothetical protein
MNNLVLYYIIFTILIIGIIILLYFILYQNNDNDKKTIKEHFIQYAKIYQENVDSSVGNEITPNLWYTFNNISNNNQSVIDKTANSNIMSIYPTTSSINTVNITSDLINNVDPNKIGDKALSLNGSSYIYTNLNSNIDNLNDKSFSILWWSKLTDNVYTSNGSYIFSKCYTNDINSANYNKYLTVGYKNSSIFCFNFLNNTFEININNNHLNNWVCFGLVYNKDINNKTIYMYLTKNDKIYEYIKSSDPLISVATEKNVNFRIGNNENNGYFKGLISNFRIYNTVISKTQFIKYYQNITDSVSLQTLNNDIINLSEIFTPNFNNELKKYPSSYLIIPDNINVYDNNVSVNSRDDNLSYIIKFSSYNSVEKIPAKLFDGNINKNTTNSYNIGGEFKLNNYTKDGVFIGDSSYTIENNIIKGEWIKITFPIPFALKSYCFIATPNLEGCAPGSWELWASNNDKDFIRLDINTANLNYYDYYNSFSLYGKQNFNNDNQTFKTYLFIFTKLASGKPVPLGSSTTNGYTLKFVEILMYGL